MALNKILSNIQFINLSIRNRYQYINIVLTIAFSIIIFNTLPFHPDFSGGITIALKYLAGERPYLDIIENNPPMTFYMHMPSAYLEMVTGIRGEYWQYGLALLLCLAVLCIGEWLRTGKAIPSDVQSRKRVNFGLITLLVMPMASFASRDQLTFVLIWPLLALYAEDAVKPRNHPAWVDLGIGLMAGLGACIKFYFVLGPITACLYLCWMKRSIKPVFAIENMAAVVVCLAYVASIKILHPAYIDVILPMMPYTYFSGHPSLLYIFSNGLLVFSSLYLVAMFLKKDERLSDPRARLLLFAALGFSAGYFAFTRNLPFRYIPPASCIFMALAAAQCHAQTSKILKFYETLFLILCMWFMYASQNYSYEGLRILRNLKIDHPKILLLDFDLGIGQPLIRDAGGTLINPGLSPWVTTGALIFMDDETTVEQRIQLARWIEWERNLTAQAAEKNPPDVILVSNKIYPNWFSWANMDVRMAKMLKHYKQVGSTEYVFILIKKTPEELAKQALQPSLVD